MGKCVLTNYIDIKKRGVSTGFCQLTPAATIFNCIYSSLGAIIEAMMTMNANRPIMRPINMSPPQGVSLFIHRWSIRVV